MFSLTPLHAQADYEARQNSVRFPPVFPAGWTPDRGVGMFPTVSDVTRLLEAMQRGQPQAAEELLPLVYDELRGTAAYKMAQESSGPTLQPTAQVHEAWLRMMGDGNEQFAGRAHFFAVAAEDPVSADLVKLRYFVGMTREEVAATLGLSLHTAERLWMYARAWLRRQIAEG